MAQEPTSNDKLNLWALLYRPAIGLKRWTVIALTGLALIGFGVMISVSHLARMELMRSLVYWGTLQMWPFWVRSCIFVGMGLTITFYAAWRLHRILFRHFWPELRRPENAAALNTLIRSQRRREGPKIVTIGGGTGMPLLLRGG